MLTTTQVVKSIVGLSVDYTDEDTAIGYWLTAADYAVKRYIGFEIEQYSYPNGGTVGGDSGYYSGQDSPYLVLRQTPVVSIATLYVDPTGYFGTNPDGSFTAVTQLFEGVDFTLRYDGCLPGTSTQCSYSGVLQRIGDLWPALRQARMGRLLPVVLGGNGNISVAYTAGYPSGSIPGDLVVACAQIVARMRATGVSGVPLQSEGQGQYNYQVAQAMLNAAPELGSIRQLLAKYRRIVV